VIKSTARYGSYTVNLDKKAIELKVVIPLTTDHVVSLAHLSSGESIVLTMEPNQQELDLQPPAHDPAQMEIGEIGEIGENEDISRYTTHDLIDRWEEIGALQEQLDASDHTNDALEAEADRIAAELQDRKLDLKSTAKGPRWVDEYGNVIEPQTATK
jgi:hypothetical protein